MEYQVGDYTLRYCIDGETCLEEYYEVYDGFGELVGILSCNNFDHYEDVDEEFIEHNLITI